MQERILVTGAGGVAGVNFVRALRASERGYYIAGTDYNKYYIELPDVDSRYLTPRHDDKTFVERISSIARKEKVSFIHPQPSSEAIVLSSSRNRLPARVLLPPASVMSRGQDKLTTQELLESRGVAVARTVRLRSISDVPKAMDRLQPPVWVRARHGAGGRLSLQCRTSEEVEHWVSLWSRRGTPLSEFILQEYLPGRNIAWDSLWLGGRLVTSYCRQRLEYPFKHISPSGITGTPSVSVIVHDEKVNEVAEMSVLALSKRPQGAFSVDLKDGSDGVPRVTEVDAGKFHTTMPLWGYIAFKHLGLPWYSNLADLYVRMGLGDAPPADVPKYDLIPSGYYMIRNMDSGVVLWREDGWKQRII